ncbi:MAG: hypothetical protein JWO48_2906 [Bryobacterales bacterium]|nr:hypothetical protein [Bryobacterales bacterium]
MPKLNRALVAAATSVLCATSVMASGPTLKSNNSKSIVVKVEEPHLFTHFANIPDGADLSSIKFEGVKKFKVATQRKSTTDVRYSQDQQFRDPGRSMHCPYTQPEVRSTAYQVTYSYRGQPMASDEYGNTYFTFSVYFRPDELSPAVRETLAEHTITKGDAAAYFDLSTYRAPVRQVVIDEAASTFCDGKFIDGSWTQTNSKCENKVKYTTITTPSEYVTVRIDPALSRREQVASVWP